MRKSDAIALFGRTHQDLADAVGVTRSAISQWPDELTREQADRVIGAAVRLGRWPPAQAATSQEAA
jgi:UTP--glucose-1-phosphate uridylyltransferase